MLKNSEAAHHNVGFLHRGGQQKFPLSLFLKNDPHRADITRLGGLFSHISKSYPTDDQEEEVMRWEEGCMDDEKNRVTHATEQKPCCCLAYDTDLNKSLKDRGKNTAKSSRGQCSSIPERSSHVAAECSAASFSEEIENKPSTSNQSDPDFGYRPVRFMRTALQESRVSSAILSEEELLDAVLLLYHIAVAPNFKQVSSVFLASCLDSFLLFVYQHGTTRISFDRLIGCPFYLGIVLHVSPITINITSRRNG